MNTDTKDAFLCHNRADKDWVRKLGERIEAETIDGLPMSRRLSVFFAEWDIDYGENVVNRMNAGLTGSRYAVDLMYEHTVCDALLPKLLSGEIRVKNVERLSEEAPA